jgi:hypothetical protein
MPAIVFAILALATPVVVVALHRRCLRRSWRWLRLSLGRGAVAAIFAFAFIAPVVVVAFPALATPVIVVALRGRRRWQRRARRLRLAPFDRRCGCGRTARGATAACAIMVVVLTFLVVLAAVVAFRGRRTVTLAAFVPFIALVAAFAVTGSAVLAARFIIVIGTTGACTRCLCNLHEPVVVRLLRCQAR